MFRTGFLGMFLLAFSPLVHGQSMESGIDQNGNPIETRRPQNYKEAAEAINNILIPMRNQPGIPSTDITLQSKGGTIRLQYRNEEALPPPPPPPPPTTNIPLLLFGAGLFGMGILMWSQHRGARATPDMTAAPATATAGLGMSENFPITRVIGAGGMGVVYEATDKTLGRQVAIKKMREDIRQDPVETEHFLKEARTVASLHHPHIVDIYSVVSQGAELYIVFEYVDGRTIKDLLSERGKLSLRDIKAVLSPVCLALEFAHARQVIHRDLKPANIMINAQGVVKVMDFGIARRVSERPVSAFDDAAPAQPQMTRTLVGTPAYMAPEALRGMLCKESDIYALGIMAYEMSTGQLPFQDQDLGAPPSYDYPKPSSLIAGLPAAWDRLIAECLEPDYTKRIHSAAAFATRLAGI